MPFPGPFRSTTGRFARFGSTLGKLEPVHADLSSANDSGDSESREPRDRLKFDRRLQLPIKRPPAPPPPQTEIEKVAEDACESGGELDAFARLRLDFTFRELPPFSCFRY